MFMWMKDCSLCFMDGGAVSFDQKRSEGMWFTVAIDPWVTVRQDG